MKFSSGIVAAKGSCAACMCEVQVGVPQRNLPTAPLAFTRSRGSWRSLVLLLFQRVWQVLPEGECLVNSLHEPVEVWPLAGQIVLKRGH